MCFDEKSSAGSFVGTAGFHPDEAIFDKIGAADAMLGGDFVEGVKKVDRVELSAVHGDWCAGFKTDLDFFGFVRGFFRRDDPLPHRFVWCVGRIFELAAFVTEMPDVAIAAVDVFLALLDGNVVLLGGGNGIFPPIDV